MISNIKAILAGSKCTCLTKTPKYSYHKKECKYRMFIEKDKWVNEANAYLISITGEWNADHSLDYCESLYESYVEEMGVSLSAQKTQLMKI